MLGKALLFAAALFGLAACDKPVISPCTGNPNQYSAPTDLLQAKAYTITPPNPHAGDTLTAGFSGAITEQINEGVIVIDVTLSGIIPIQQNISLSTVGDIRRQLPLKPGPFSLTETVSLPSFLFGQVEGSVHIYSDTGKQVTCVNIHVDLGA
eukprot:comp9087_c0_seq1/m.4261 comp9087_c0_seq1/g.4261  ORF comp9087_c0_seq1/g.4261 comp9087_c0_seq1/m.4261 type:complete len:152 (-) comp9087_c0_seq1:740-1195(-)